MFEKQIVLDTINKYLGGIDGVELEVVTTFAHNHTDSELHVMLCVNGGLHNLDNLSFDVFETELIHIARRSMYTLLFHKFKGGDNVVHDISILMEEMYNKKHPSFMFKNVDNLHNVALLPENQNILMVGGDGHISCGFFNANIYITNNGQHLSFLHIDNSSFRKLDIFNSLVLVHNDVDFDIALDRLNYYYAKYENVYVHRDLKEQMFELHKNDESMIKSNIDDLSKICLNNTTKEIYLSSFSEEIEIICRKYYTMSIVIDEYNKSVDACSYDYRCETTSIASCLLVDGCTDASWIYDKNIRDIDVDEQFSEYSNVKIVKTPFGIVNIDGISREYQVTDMDVDNMEDILKYVREQSNILIYQLKINDDNGNLRLRSFTY